MNAAAYLRVSSVEQVDGTSLDIQKAQIEAYCALKGIELVATFQDPGVSGGKPIADRPEGAKLVELVESSEIQAVVILKLDRAFRDTVDCLRTVEAWENRGVALHVVDLGGNSIDSTSPAGRFMLTVLAAAGEMERGMIRDRCSAGRRARMAEGKRGGEIPFGHDLAEDGKTLVENPQEQAIIRDILELNSDGYSLRAIARELGRRGVRTKKGGNWSHQQIASILKRAA